MSASNPPRLLMVDDSDPRITYTPSWFSDDGSAVDNLGGNFGSAFNSTQHGTSVDGSFQFQFSGTQIFVYGTTNLKISAASFDPKWECFIDGISIGATAPFKFPENNWQLCLATSLADAQHTLTVKVKSKGHVFWFDYLQYVPSANVPLDNALVVVNHTDPYIQYDSTWEVLGEIANMTQVTGASAVFDFIGVKLSWYSVIPTELPVAPSIATYTVDGATPSSFALQGLSNHSVPTQYHQLAFETPVLAYGSHRITVAFGSDGTSTPLTLSYLLIQNGTGSLSLQSSPSAVSSLPTASTPSPSSSASQGTRANVGGIVGGILGALAILGLAGLTLYILKRRNKAKSFDVSNTIPIPFYTRPVHRDSATDSFTSSRPIIQYEAPNQVSRTLPPSREERHTAAPAPSPQPLTFENLRALDPTARHGSPPPPQNVVPHEIHTQNVSGVPHRRHEQGEASHRRRRSRGGATHHASGGPSRLQPLSPVDRGGDGTDPNAAYMGGYQTWGQTKALEAAAQRKNPRDSYM